MTIFLSSEALLLSIIDTMEVSLPIQSRNQAPSRTPRSILNSLESTFKRYSSDSGHLPALPVDHVVRVWDLERRFNYVTSTINHQGFPSTVRDQILASLFKMELDAVELHKDIALNILCIHLNSPKQKSEANLIQLRQQRLENWATEFKHWATKCAKYPGDGITAHLVLLRAKEEK